MQADSIKYSNIKYTLINTWEQYATYIQIFLRRLEKFFMYFFNNLQYLICYRNRQDQNGKMAQCYFIILLITIYVGIHHFYGYS